MKKAEKTLFIFLLLMIFSFPITLDVEGGPNTFKHEGVIEEGIAQLSRTGNQERICVENLNHQYQGTPCVNHLSEPSFLPIKPQT